MGEGEIFKVRRMTADETFLIREWAAEEGWNPGLHDAACFFSTDPRGFFIGELDGAPVAMISGVAHDASFGFIGLYIVKPGFRGRGYGLRTWQTAMDYLGERTVGLDGVLAQQKNYENSGFRFSHHHIRYRGEGGGATPSGLVPLSSVPFDAICAYDAECSPSPRSRFLRGWVDLRDSVGLAMLRNGKLRGFAVMRPCVEGFKIGPLLADDDAAAEALVRGMLAQRPGQAVFLDVPDAPTPGPQALAQRLGMQEVFRTARMYTRPVAHHPRVVGIATMELG